MYGWKFEEKKSNASNLPNDRNWCETLKTLAVADYININTVWSHIVLLYYAYSVQSLQLEYIKIYLHSLPISCVACIPYISMCLPRNCLAYYIQYCGQLVTLARQRTPHLIKSIDINEKIMYKTLNNTCLKWGHDLKWGHIFYQYCDCMFSDI